MLNKILRPCQRTKKNSKIKVILIPVIVGALGTVLKTQKKKFDKLEIRGRIETIQTTALLKSARIFRRVQEN